MPPDRPETSIPHSSPGMGQWILLGMSASAILACCLSLGQDVGSLRTWVWMAALGACVCGIMVVGSALSWHWIDMDTGWLAAILLLGLSSSCQQ